MSLPEIITLVIAAGAFLVSLLTALSKVKQGEFQILRETVDALDTEAKRLRADLRAAEEKIAELEDENTALKGRVAELEVENQQLRRQVNGVPAG